MQNIKFSFNRLKLILLFPVIFLWPGGFASAASSAVLFYEDFEDAIDYTNTFGTQEGEGIHEISTEQKRAGSSSFKFSITCPGPWETYKIDRDELLMKAKIFDGDFHVTIGKEYWIGFSLFLAEGYYTPEPENGWIVHFNFHDVPDGPPRCEESEGWARKANFQISTGDIDGPGTPKWSLYGGYDSVQCSSDIEGNYYVRPGPYADDIGQWTDFVINVKWDYDDDGFIKVWKNGVLIVDRVGGTCFNDLYGPYMKFGIYSRVLEKDQVVTIYYDELRIGDSNSSYNEVAPRGEVLCAENWICEDWSDWSDCLDNQQSRTRTCTDSNECGTEDDKPKLIETQDCEILPTYNLTDFITLVSDWLKSETNLTSDLNNDNTVNTRDLGIMMSHWE